MQTSLLHNLVVGTPVISATYDQIQKPVNRYLPGPATQCQRSTTKSKQSIFFFFTDKYLTLIRLIYIYIYLKLFSLVDGTDSVCYSDIAVRVRTDISETVMRKLSLGARILRVGGVENVFKQFFSVREGERLLKASQCYLSTTSGPLPGFLFISTDKVAFCSERSMKVFTHSGQMLRIRYKVSHVRNNLSMSLSPTSNKMIKLNTVLSGFNWSYMCITSLIKIH